MSQTITDSARFALQRRAREVLGEQEGDTLMAHLPPVGWADVATKQDLQVLSADIGAVRAEIEALRLAMKADIAEAIKGQTVWMTSLLVGLASIFAGLVVWLVERLAG